MGTDARIVELETRVAHQDESINELSAEIYRQQQQISALEVQCRHLTEKLQSVDGGQPPAEPGDEVPPHY